MKNNYHFLNNPIQSSPDCSVMSGLNTCTVFFRFCYLPIQFKLIFL
ncbi:hypothetical protein KSS87_015541 [Heliosperma pusillum]|nr:hypothetical protein KSS87_015541 [Heliosperma pusillum]